MASIRVGDYIEWDEPQYKGGSFFRGRYRGGAKFVGVKHRAGKVIKHSYGEKTNQHTFTVLLADGTKKFVKGRNLYPNLTVHIVDENSPDRINVEIGD